MKSLYRLQYITLGLFATSCLLTGCQTVPVIEKSEPTQVIQEEFTQTAIALTNELNAYESIEELFIENEADNALDTQIRKYIQDNPEIRKNQLNLDTLDLKLFVKDSGEAFFIAVMSDEKNRPYTEFGYFEKSEDGKYVVKGEHIGAYAVNMPKTYLLENNGEWAVVSQRPFSTFEECYFFRLESGKMKLYQRGWEDPSLLYYSSLNELLEAGKIDEAMKVEDTSMYPMGYEQILFETANLMVTVSEQQAQIKEQNSEADVALTYIEWSLNYYFENHFGCNLEAMVMDAFKPMQDASEGDFGYAYRIEPSDLKPILLHYANLLGKVGRDKEAETYRSAIERAFQAH